jgi:hypothetical protein
VLSVVIVNEIARRMLEQAEERRAGAVAPAGPAQPMVAEVTA